MRGKRKAIFIFIIMIVIIIAIMLTPLFDIKSIQVTGLKVLETEKIVEKSEFVLGNNLFISSTKKAIKKILEEPYVHYVKVSRKLPGTMNIDVIERSPIALVPYVGSWLVIDNEGCVLESRTEISTSTLPILEGVVIENFEVGMPLELEELQLQNMISIITAVKEADMAPLLSQINVEDLTNIKYKAKVDIQILLGGIDNITYKTSFAKSILEAVLQTNDKGIIDMTHEGNPIFRVE